MSARRLSKFMTTRVGDSIHSDAGGMRPLPRGDPAFLLHADTAGADRHGPVAHQHAPDAVRVAGARRDRRATHAQERDELRRRRWLRARELAVVLDLRV